MPRTYPACTPVASHPGGEPPRAPAAVALAVREEPRLQSSPGRPAVLLVNVCRRLLEPPADRRLGLGALLGESHHSRELHGSPPLVRMEQAVRTGERERALVVSPGDVLRHDGA